MNHPSLKLQASALSSISSEKQADWFSSRRDFFVRQVIEEFFFVYRRFHKIHAAFHRNSTTAPADKPQENILDLSLNAALYNKLEGLVGTETEKGALWDLKNLCHRVWPRNSSHPEKAGCLMDWLVGSLFHETVKFKENVYLIISYGAANELCFQEEQGEDSIPRPVHRHKSAEFEIHEFWQRITIDAKGQLDIMMEFCHRINALLREMMGELVDNPLVIRFLLEHEKTIQIFWGESVEDVYGDIFGGDPAEGFCSAGRSYYQAQWYRRSLKAYKRALQVNDNCGEAVVRISYLDSILKDSQLDPVIL